MGTFFAQNFEVVSARTGLEAMGWLTRGFIPDIIIADAGAPELSGIEIAMNLSYSGMFGHIPVILMNTGPEAQDQRALQELGIRAVFGNPFDPVQLRDRVSQLTALSGELAWAGATAA
jgi:CheY-like chemotaxis protein